jgi:hypothetical protein
VIGLTFLLGVLQEKAVHRVTIHGESAKLDAVQRHLFAEEMFPVPPEYEFRALQQEAPLPGRGRLTHFPLKHPGGSLGFRSNTSVEARMRGRLLLNGTSEVRGSFGEISGPHVSHATTLWLQTLAALSAGDTVELESTGRIASVGDQLWREVIVPGD